MFEQTQFLYFNNSFVGIKTKVGAFLSLFIIAVFTWICIDTFRKYLDQNMTFSKVDDLIENHIPVNMTLTLSYPKEINEYGRWLAYSEFGYISIQDEMNECTDEDFKKYFPHKVRNFNNTYICFRINNPSVIESILLTSCSKLNTYYTLRTFKDPTCSKLLNNITEKNEIMFDKKYSSYNVYYNSYNITNKNYTYNNLSLSLEGNDTIKVYSLNTYFNNIFIDSNEFINNVEVKHSTNVEIANINYYTNHEAAIFELNFVNKEIIKSIYFSMKINIILTILTAIFKILFGIGLIVIYPYTIYSYKLHILSNDFSIEEYQNISNKLSINKSNTQDNSNLKEKENFKSKCLGIYSFYAKLKSSFIKSDDFDEVDKAINEKISLERILIGNDESYKLYQSNLTKPSFLSKFDFLSSTRFIKFKQKSNFCSNYHVIATVLSGIIFLIILIGLRINMYDPINKLEYIDMKPFIEYKYNNETNNLLNKLIKINLPKTAYESFKIVKVDNKNNSFSNIKHWPCKNDEIIEHFNSNFETNNTISICINLNDALNDLFNTKFKVHQIHLINCTDVPNLFKESDCKSTVSYNEEIYIETEIENLGKITKIPLIKNGLVRNNKNKPPHDKGYFKTDIIPYSEKNLLEQRDSIKLVSNTFKVDQIYGLKNTLFSWIFEIKNSYNVIVDNRDTNFLTVFSLALCYYGLLLLALNFLFSVYLEYKYFDEAKNTIISKEETFEKNIDVSINNDSKIDINSNDQILENATIKNNYVNKHYRILNKIKQTEKKEVHLIDISSKINFLNYILFKANLLNIETEKMYKLIIDKMSYNSFFRGKNSTLTLKIKQTSFLNNFDFLARQTNFFLINRNFTYKNSVGGILSIIIFCIFITSIYFLNIDYFKKSNPKIRVSKVSKEEANLNKKFTPIYDFSLHLEKDLFESSTFYNSSISMLGLIQNNIIYKCNNTNIIEDADSHVYCISKNTYFANYNYLTLVPNCKNKNFTICTNQIHNIKLNFTLLSYDLEKMHKGLIKNSHVDNLKLNIKELPIYMVNFEALMVNVNTGLIFDEYKQYNFTRIMNVVLSYKTSSILPVFIIKNNLEIHLNEQIFEEVYVNNKTITECLIEVLSLFNIFFNLGEIISNFLSEYYLLKTVYEIQKYKKKYVLEKFEIGFYEFAKNYFLIDSKITQEKINYLMNILSFESMLNLSSE